MPRKSEITKKIEAKLDKLMAELEETDRGLLDLNVKREAISFQIQDMRELLTVPKPAKKKAAKKAKPFPVLQCPHCGEIADKSEWPESEKNNGMLRCPKCQAEIKDHD